MGLEQPFLTPILTLEVIQYRPEAAGDKGLITRI